MHSDPAAQPQPASFDGRMSDGRTAASVPVQVSFTDTGLAMKAPGTPDPVIWSYPSLTTAEPLRKASSDALISSSEMPGATLFVESADFTRTLSQRAAHLSTGALRWQYAKPGLMVTAAIAAIVAAVWLFDLTPARTIAGWLPDPVRVRMGQQVVQSMTKDYPTCHTDDGRAALDKLTARLSAVSGGREKFNVVVVDWGLLNAFATPGSQIVMTKEIITDAKSPDEVAGVLAHEMGHGLELHPETGLVRAIGMSAALELMSGGNTGTLANVGALLAQLSYTRVAEREADNHAVRILKAATISPKGLADFFQRISKLEGDGEEAKKDPEKKDETISDEAKKDGKDESAASERSYTSYFNTDLLRTHPQSQERAKLIKAQAAYDATPALSEDEWQALRGICKNAKKKLDDKKKADQK
ncbi:MAG: M48 family metallopeptidase [Hyphomicrobiaceae bacterium]|nr:M48 family metallopeptidase [Hyphomicrobiaceae bacterium]